MLESHPESNESHEFRRIHTLREMMAATVGFVERLACCQRAQATRPTLSTLSTPAATTHWVLATRGTASPVQAAPQIRQGSGRPVLAAENSPHFTPNLRPRITRVAHSTHN